MQVKDQPIYILGDGDRIGERIEALLLGGDLEALTLLSRQLSDSISRLADEFKRTMEADVIMSAGDDLLVRVPAHVYDNENLQQLADAYRMNTGASISFGVGFTVEKAYVNLRRAKSSKTQKIVEETDSEASQ